MEPSQDLTNQLLDWFAQQARDLPWRHNRSPYRVWIAEVMLQQTQVETVIPYYERFLARFPTLESLAAAPLEAVLKLWEGLGYYARARHLHAAAQQVVVEQDGRLPDTFEELIPLPGFGPYTAGAVASIAFGQPVIALDGNARRVLARLFAVEGNPRRAPAQRQLQSLARSLLPHNQPGLFNEALMELGATICLPRTPQCERCPVIDHCQAHQQGRQESLPTPAPRRSIPHYQVAAAVLTREDGRILVARRVLDDFLGGLWEFPGGKQEKGESLQECLVREMQEELGIQVQVGTLLTTLKHPYTHFRVTIHAFHCHLHSGEPRCLECADFRWITPPELDDLPMSAADRKIAQLVQEGAR